MAKPKTRSHAAKQPPTPLPKTVVPISALPPHFVAWASDENILLHLATVLDGQVTAQDMERTIPRNSRQALWLRAMIQQLRRERLAWEFGARAAKEPEQQPCWRHEEDDEDSGDVDDTTADIRRLVDMPPIQGSVRELSAALQIAFRVMGREDTEEFARRWRIAESILLGRAS